MKGEKRRRPLPGKSEDRPRVDWLSRAIARSGYMTLEDAEAAIRAGRVTIFGRVVKQPMAMLQPGDEVKIDGHLLSLKRETKVLMFHKPAGVITAQDDRHALDTVFSLLRNQLPPELHSYEWHAVGRLDRGTTGILLFTNDERFVAHATSPDTKLGKRYVAQVQGTPTEEQLEPLRHGIDLEDGRTRPAKVVLRGPSEVVVTLTEGRNHQVKRMLGAVGFPVKALHREAIGKLQLDVEPGQFRELTPEEISGPLGFS